LNLRRSRLVIHLLLGLALLVAQAGAQAHAYSHMQGSATKSDVGAAGQLCRECLSFAPVALPGGSPSAVEFAITVGAVECPALSYALPVQQTYIAYYRSRAPPTLL
jgi:hypothetical protein